MVLWCAFSVQVICQSNSQVLSQCFHREEVTDQKRPETRGGREVKGTYISLSHAVRRNMRHYVVDLRTPSDNSAGEEAGCECSGLSWFQVVSGCEADWRQFMVEKLTLHSLATALFDIPSVNMPIACSLKTCGIVLCEKTAHFKVAFSCPKHKMHLIQLNVSVLWSIWSPLILFSALVLTLQTSWRGYRERAKYLRIRQAVIVIQSAWRGMISRQKARRRRHAVDIIRKFIKGFIYRHYEHCPENEYFLDHQRFSFLMMLFRNPPKSVLDKSWPIPPPCLTEASEHLCRLCMRNMMRAYCRRIQPEWKKQMEQKVVASQIFKDQKDSYPQSVPKLFVASRLNSEEFNLKVIQTLGNDKVKVMFATPVSPLSLCCCWLSSLILLIYGIAVTKYDRRGYKARPRQLLLTSSFAMLVAEAKLKQRIDYATLRSISVSSLSDGFMVLHVPSEDNKQKSDVVLQCDHLIEVVTKLATMADKKIKVNMSQDSITFAVARGKEGVIDFTSGPELKVAKCKKGHLLVVSKGTEETHYYEDSMAEEGRMRKGDRGEERTCRWSMRRTGDCKMESSSLKIATSFIFIFSLEVLTNNPH
ncbi:unnamed protein product [Oncorhynchus mykiss]|uniref:TH1 domain-containing protein n=1 Tax=Oncorhynchus mykiss TaxID=8022 RepID=A0A060WR16_ONCMY|nr:unnamed protein product [Oncorhynchus mykiss]